MSFEHISIPLVRVLDQCASEMNKRKNNATDEGKDAKRPKR